MNAIELNKLKLTDRKYALQLLETGEYYISSGGWTRNLEKATIFKYKRIQEITDKRYFKIVLYE